MRCPFKNCTWPECPCEEIVEVLEKEYEPDAESASRSIDKENAKEINRRYE